MTKYISMKPALLFLLLIGSLQVHAQLDSCSIFLKGNYLEVGINDNGAYGSGAPAPTGYHPKGSTPVYNLCSNTCPPTSACLGFVADPDKDGWTIGAPYAYYGDYMLPGTPQEGWTIRCNGTESNNWNENGCASTIVGSGITGHNISYTNTGRYISGIWQGGFNNLQITQVSTIDTGRLYLKILTVIRDTGTTTSNDVYYMRTIDPDNAQPQTGSYNTKNTIGYQLPNNKNRTLVSAIGTNNDATNTPIPSAYLGLGSGDCRAKCFRLTNMSGLAPAKTTDILYAATDTVYQKYQGTETVDAGMGIVFKLGNIAPGDSVVFTYAYIFSAAEADSVFSVDKSYWIVNNATSTAFISGDTATVCGNPVPITIYNPDHTTWTWSSPTGSSLSPLTGSNVNVTVGSTAAVLIAISDNSTCRTQDTVKMILQPGTLTTPTISISGPYLKAPGQAVNMNAIVTNAGSGYTITWVKNGATIPSTSIGTSITYIKSSGIDTITATVMPPGSSCFDTSISNTWYVFDGTAVPQINASNNIQVYPNPLTNEMTISGLSVADRVTVYNMMGRTMQNWRITKDGSNTLHTTMLPTGVYILSVFDKEGNIKTKIPIQKL